MKFEEIASKINEHLQRLSQSGQDKVKLYQPFAYYSGKGPKMYVRYVFYWTEDYLSKAEAIEYLSWLDAGNIGYQYHCKKELKNASTKQNSI